MIPRPECLPPEYRSGPFTKWFNMAVRPSHLG